MMPAMRFSKPSPLRFENGMSAGSAQTLSTSRVTRSGICCAAIRLGASVARTTAASAPRRARRHRGSASETGLLGIRRRLGLVFALGRPHAPERAIGPGLEIDVDVVEVAGHVHVLAEGWHHVLAARSDVLAALNDDLDELLIGEPV